MIVLHHVLSLLHAAFFIERHGFFVGDQINGDVLLPARQLMGGPHQTPADALVGEIPVHAQIGDVQPVGEVRQPQQRSHQPARAVPRREADGGILQQSGMRASKRSLGY